MTQREQVTRLEISTIQPIALDQRHGTARDLFTVWFGSNIMLLTVVTGGLAVTVFALPFTAAVLGLTLGNLVGAIFMALHAAQGPTLGVPQMVQTRGQFGSLGSLLVVGIVIVMYVGFLASNLVMGGEALASLAPGMSDTPGIVLVGVLGVVAAIYGYDLIHAYTRVMAYASGAVLALAFAWIVWVHGLPADFLTRNEFNWSGFLGAISTGALWQIAYAPYVSDYSRYMPYGTGARPAFWASYWGCALGSLLPMILGAMVGLAAPKGNLVAGTGDTGAWHRASGADRVFSGHRLRQRHESILRCAVHFDLRADLDPLLVAGAHGARHRLPRSLRFCIGGRVARQGILPRQLRGIHPDAALRAGAVDGDQPGRLLPSAAWPI